MLQPWYVRSRPLQHRTGSRIFDAIYGHLLKQPNRSTDGASWQTIATLLESPYPLLPETPQPRIARYSICAGPPRWQKDRPKMWTPPCGEILPMLAQRLAMAQPESVLLTETGEPAQPIEPFAGGWLGWLGYDLAWEIETLPTYTSDPLPFPVAFWYEPDTFVVMDHQAQLLWLAATQPDQLDPMEAAIARSSTLKPRSPIVFADQLDFASSQAIYEQAVRKAKAHIQAGDIFQANLSLRFSTQTQADSWAIYQRLHAINPSPFASYWHTPWGSVISCSPERLVSLQGDRAETRPIAGTRPRGQTAACDQTLAQELLSNPKERAEHVMLVDLERNDLGRVCQWGSVQVDELMTVEPYSHVMHLVSNVTGTLSAERTAVDLIRATFPGGTITGCPKVRCMEIIEALEPVRRSLFYGSCGFLDHRGHLDLNILIRTLLWAEGRDPNAYTVWGQVGAGIVADSQPTQEWRESLQKAKAQLLAIGMTIE
ncbi:anthranilate synthase component I [Oscillatoria sp. CS-180]|uniref:anthranilate synthase component I n=1 Tax=Oscillatoria sp. CS-180 TaxID=3021720 RepID=UPI00232D39C9|nr:anthranilate synthase component I [Oscillatoria sp. CS-180]MDB9528809.1 anthranilate synthase component I [Oscillatoria sp. CS-180]